MITQLELNKSVLFKLSIVNQLILDIFKYTCNFAK